MAGRAAGRGLTGRKLSLSVIMLNVLNALKSGLMKNRLTFFRSRCRVNDGTFLGGARVLRRGKEYGIRVDVSSFSIPMYTRARRPTLTH